MLLLSSFYIAIVSAQLRYPIQGAFKKKSAQGMAIYEDTAYLMHDGGMCRVFDLKNGRVVRNFHFKSRSKYNHINNACFGRSVYGNNKVPLVYLSECMQRGRCFVEQIEGGSSRLVQTIEAFKNGKNWRMTNWVVDNDNGFLYGVTRNRKETLDSVGNVVCHIVKFRIPSLEEGNKVAFSEKDLIDHFEVVFPNILQGCKIRKGKLYLLAGLMQTLSHRKDSKRAVLIVDLKKKKLMKTYDLTYTTTNEPEDMDFYKGKWLLYCGGECGIYELNIK